MTNTHTKSTDPLPATRSQPSGFQLNTVPVKCVQRVRARSLCQRPSETTEWWRCYRSHIVTVSHVPKRRRVHRHRNAVGISQPSTATPLPAASTSTASTVDTDGRRAVETKFMSGTRSDFVRSPSMSLYKFVFIPSPNSGERASALQVKHWISLLVRVCCASGLMGLFQMCVLHVHSESNHHATQNTRANSTRDQLLPELLSFAPCHQSAACGMDEAQLFCVCVCTIYR